MFSWKTQIMLDDYVDRTSHNYIVSKLT